MVSSPDSKTTNYYTEEHEDFHDSNGERWLVSYADMMTLLFGFFVLLYVYSEEPKEIPSALKNFSEESKLNTEKIESQSMKDEATKKIVTKNDPNSDASSKISREELERLSMRGPCRMCINFLTIFDQSVLTKLGVADSTAVIITEVSQHRPAWYAGLLPGDILMKFGDTSLKDIKFKYDHIRKTLQKAPVNSTLNLEVLRNQKTIKVSILLDGMDESVFKEIQKLPLPTKYRVGDFVFQDINLRLRVEKYIPTDVEGLMIINYPIKNSWSPKIEIEDIIIEADNSTIKSIEDLKKLDILKIEKLRLWSVKHRYYYYSWLH